MIHGNWLACWAQQEGQKNALIDLESGESTAYAELNLRADQVAHFLQDRFGLKQGDRVAVMGQNRVEQVELYFGLAKLGAILVPVNWRLAPDEAAYILSDSTPVLLFYGHDVHATVAAMRQGLWSGKTVSFDQEYPVLRAAASDAPVLTEGLTDESPAMILYTSGTTGRPKGAIQTHGMITWNAVNTVTGWDLRRDDITLTHTPFFHTGGWNVLTLPLLHRGATVVLARTFDPDQTVTAIDQYGVTVMFAVPTMYQMIWDSPNMQSASLKSVRFFDAGGAPCPVPLIEAFSGRGVVFKQGYGMTEVGPNCFFLDERDAIAKAGSVGFAALHLDARVVNDQGELLPAGEIGQLQLPRPVVCGGYWNNPAATKAAIDEAGWFSTGDLFRVDEDGYHYVIGRLIEMYISGGENVYPAEIERVLYAVPEVTEAAVIGVADQRWGEVGMAFVALDSGAAGKISAESLLEQCRRKLANYKVPKTVVIRESLPKGPSGKILKTVLRDSLA